MPAHILVIDDDSPILEMMRLVLENEGGYRVTTSEVLFEDLTEIEYLQPDLILLDLQLGERLVGWDFLQKLKLYRGTMHIPVILCTAALSNVQDQESVWLQKRIPILYKPFSIDNLLLLVSQHLAHSPSANPSVHSEG